MRCLRSHRNISEGIRGQIFHRRKFWPSHDKTFPHSRSRWSIMPDILQKNGTDHNRQNYSAIISTKGLKKKHQHQPEMEHSARPWNKAHTLPVCNRDHLRTTRFTKDRDCFAQEGHRDIRQGRFYWRIGDIQERQDGIQLSCRGSLSPIEIKNKKVRKSGRKYIVDNRTDPVIQDLRPFFW